MFGVALVVGVIGFYLGAIAARNMLMGTINEGLSAVKSVKKVMKGGGGKAGLVDIVLGFLQQAPPPPQQPPRKRK
jgi:hypothetical protein